MTAATGARRPRPGPRPAPEATAKPPPGRQRQPGPEQPRPGKKKQPKPEQTTTKQSKQSKRPVRAPRALPFVVGGVVWAGLLLVTVSTTVVGLAVVVTAVTLVAAPTAWRAASKAAGAPAALRPGALLGALALIGISPLVAAVDPWAGLVSLLAGGLVVTVRSTPEVRPALAAVLPGLAGFGLVALAGEGGEAAVVLVLAICLFDAANAVMGTGETGGWPGAVSGVLTVAVLMVAVQAVLAPPFTSNGVWILGAVAALGAPAGIQVCRRLAPGRLPALRRVDSLVLVAPVWAVASLGLVHH